MLPGKVKKSLLLFVVRLEESERKEAYLNWNIYLILTTYWPIRSKWRTWICKKKWHDQEFQFLDSSREKRGNCDIVGKKMRIEDASIIHLNKTSVFCLLKYKHSYNTRHGCWFPAKRQKRFVYTRSLEIEDKLQYPNPELGKLHRKCNFSCWFLKFYTSQDRDCRDKYHVWRMGQRVNQTKLTIYKAFRYLWLIGKLLQGNFPARVVLKKLLFLLF